MGFPDFPIPDRGKSYLPSREILEFLESYAANFKVKERIKFEHFVIRVRPVDNEWEVSFPFIADIQIEVINERNFRSDYCKGSSE